jgi:hypothetical protein
MLRLARRLIPAKLKVRMERSVDHKHSDHYERGRTVEVLLRSSERASLSLANSHSFFGMRNRHWNKQTYAGRHSQGLEPTKMAFEDLASSMDLLLLSCRVRVRVDLYQDLALLAL